MSRIVIAGWPRVGKTWLAAKLGAELGIPVRHTDDLIGTHDWSAASLAASAWMEDPGPFIVEGVAVPRALRKLLTRFDGRPADVLYWSDVPRESLSIGQTSMGKGCTKVLDEIRNELVRRGVRLELF